MFYTLPVPHDEWRLESRMYQEDAATGKIIDYLSSKGGSTTRDNRKIAEELGLKYTTVRDAVHRLQRYGKVTLRDEDNRLSLVVTQ